MMNMMGFPFLSMLIPLALLVGGGIALSLYLRRKNHPQIEAGQQRDQLESRVYRLAHQHKGVLTVSTVVTELGIGPKTAEDLLTSMSDGIRVRTEVNDQGLLYFEFIELLEE